VLRDANVGKTIIKTVSFTVSTSSATPEQGGGTTNIAFLRGAGNSSPGGLIGGLVGGVAGALTGASILPNAEAVQMFATFWIETVQHKIVVPPFKPGQVSELHLSLTTRIFRIYSEILC
jgi:hypothetical protein